MILLSPCNDLRAALHGGLGLGLHIRSADVWLDGNGVDDATNANERVSGGCPRTFLEPSFMVACAIPIPAAGQETQSPLGRDRRTEERASIELPCAPDHQGAEDFAQGGDMPARRIRRKGVAAGFAPNRMTDSMARGLLRTRYRGNDPERRKGLRTEEGDGHSRGGSF